MEYIDNDELLDKLLENVKVKNEMYLFLSLNFEKRLKKINHEISKEILKTSNEHEKKFNFSYIDETEDPEMVSFIMVNKIPTTDDKEFIITPNIYKLSVRVNLKIGKLITKLFGTKFPANRRKDSTSIKLDDVESFVNMYKSTFNKFDDFKIVKGDDIPFYYNMRNYIDYATGRLGNSCMRDVDDRFFDIYALNDNVSMVILEDKSSLIYELNDDEDFSLDNNGEKIPNKEHPYKIRGRAILWDLTYLNNEKTDRKFLERIYTTNEDDMYLYIEYAKKNGWLYKSTQSYGREYAIIDPIDDSKNYREMAVKVNKTSYKYYPYVDTLSHFNNGILDNEINPYEGIILTDTCGQYEETEETVYSEYHQESILEADARWCEYDNDWCRQEDAIYLRSRREYCTPSTEVIEYDGDYYVEDDCVYDDYNEMSIPEDVSVYCERENKNILNSNAIYLEYYNEYCTPDANLKTTIDDEQIFDEDAIYSHHYDGYIHRDDAQEVIIDNDNNTDYFKISDLNELYYEKDNKYYINKLKDFQMEIPFEKNENEKIIYKFNNFKI